jgi:hypothetical protein
MKSRLYSVFSSLVEIFSQISNSYIVDVVHAAAPSVCAELSEHVALVEEPVFASSETL